MLNEIPVKKLTSSIKRYKIYFRCDGCGYPAGNKEDVKKGCSCGGGSWISAWRDWNDEYAFSKFADEEEE